LAVSELFVPHLIQYIYFSYRAAVAALLDITF